MAASFSECIRFSRCELSQLEPQPVPAAVFVNPPYGERVGEGDDLEQSWRDLGDLLRQRCLGAVAHVLSGAPELTRHLRLRTSRRFPVRNGPLDCRLLRYEIGAGPERS